MSDTDALLSRLASMEKELATLRARPKEEKSFDPVAFRAAFVADPIGTMNKMGAPVDHVTRVLVAHAMGDQAPPELKVLAAMGPTVSATNALESKLEQLSRQVSSIVDQGARSGVREGFKALTSDKTKYPHLSKAASVDPSFFDDEVGSHGGTAEELATALEARLSRMAKVYAPPASSENAETVEDPSTQIKPALAGALSGNQPPLPKPTVGLLTKEDDDKLKAEILQKYPQG